MCVGLEYGSLETVGPRTEHKKLAPSLWRDSFEVNACYIMKLKPFKNRRMGAVWHFGLWAGFWDKIPIHLKFGLVKIRGERYCYAIWQVDIEFFQKQHTTGAGGRSDTFFFRIQNTVFKKWMWRGLEAGAQAHLHFYARRQAWPCFIVVGPSTSMLGWASQLKFEN